VPGKNPLIALQSAHVVKCPYCIDAYTKMVCKRVTKEDDDGKRIPFCRSRLLKVEPP